MAVESEDPGWLARVIGRATLALLTAGLQLADLFCLLARGDLLRAYGRLLQARWRRSPYRWDDSFETQLAASSAGAPRRALTFGATPVVSARRLLIWAGARPGAVVFDAGAGRGHVLLAALRLGAEARGAELVRDHVAAAGPVLADVGASLEAADAAKVDLQGVTHVFCAWTLIDEAGRQVLERSWAELDPGAMIVTLGGAPQGADFEVIGTRAVLVTWGIEQAHLARRR